MASLHQEEVSDATDRSQHPSGPQACRPLGDPPPDRHLPAGHDRGHWTGVRTAAAQQGARAADVDAVFSTYASPQSPGCVVGVVQAGELVLARGYGMADLEQGTPLSARSVMNVAWMAKQFTAASIALLAADGVLSLDDDIRKFLPELPELPTRAAPSPPWGAPPGR